MTPANMPDARAPARTGVETILRNLTEPAELLRATSVPLGLQPAPPWSTYNLTLTEAGSDGDGPYATFTHADPAKSGNLSQCCELRGFAGPGMLSAYADMRARGEGVAGLNIYLYPLPGSEKGSKVFQAAHPGDGEWRRVMKSIALPAGPVDRVRLMLVLRPAGTTLGVRDVSLRYVPETDAARPDLARLHVSEEFHAAVLDVVARHPAAGDPAFREKLYRSLIGGNRKGSRVVAEVLQYLRPAGFDFEGSRFLDLGCGTGGSLAGASTSGAAWCEGWEINSEKLELARINLSTMAKPGSQIEIRNKSIEDPASLRPDFDPFDLVFCQEVLEHVKDLDAALNTLSRCIAPERGVAYVTIPNGFALESVLRDPHLQLFGITLLDRVEAQPFATALKNHTHYSEMMGSYYRYGEYLERFAQHELAAVPLNVPSQLPRVLEKSAQTLGALRQETAGLQQAWGNIVDPQSLALLEARLDNYLQVATARLHHAMARDATREQRLSFVMEFANPHFEFLIAHRNSTLRRKLARLRSSAT